MKKIFIVLLCMLTIISCKKKDTSGDPSNTPLLEGGTQIGVVVPKPSGTAIAPGISSTGAAITSTGGSTPNMTGSPEEDKKPQEVLAATQLPQVDPAEANINPITSIKEKKVVLKLGKNEFQSKKNKVVTLDNVEKGIKLTKKLHLTGKIPTNWVFEGSFPINVYDTSNGLLGTGVGKANIFDKNGEVTKSDVVSFESDIDLMIPAQAKKGVLKLSADNPSGIPQNDDSILIDVVF